MNVADLLSRQAAATPQATAVIRGDLRLTYEGFESLVWGLCRHLRDNGLRAGETVGLHLDDPLLHLAAILALARSGLISVAVAVEGAGIDGGIRILARTGASRMIEADRSLDWGLPGPIALDPDCLLALASAPDDALRSAEHDGLLHYKTSSGTTGDPKIVAATHSGMIASIEREISAIGYPPGERYLTPVSLRFDGPRRRYLACLASGATAVLPFGGVGPDALFETIDRHDVRHFSCVPSQAYELAAALRPGRQRFPQMRCLRLSAGPSDAPLHRLLRERLTSKILVSYGCTELGPMTVAPPELVASLPQTVGRPMPGIELQIVSTDDRPLSPGAVGLIRVRAEGMPQAYHDDAEATAKFFRNGWFYPGDLGRTNDEGLLFHMGRADGMMVMNGINIYPAEIEQAMLSHPAVRDAVAMPLKHRVANDVPVCGVVLNEGENLSERQLLAFAHGKLGSHRPRRIAVLDGIPRNEHGKVQRSALEQAIVSLLDADRSGAAKRSGREAPVDPDFDGEMRQLSLFATVTVRPPSWPDLARLDSWLGGLLGLDVSDEPAAVAMPKSDSRRLADAWLRRTLRLTRLLLQGARLPVFDEPRAIACRPDESRDGIWHARVAFPLVEELPNAAYGVAFKGAVHLNQWAMSRPVDAQNIQAFYALAEERVTTRLLPILRLGKSTLPVLRVAHRRSIPFTHLGAGVFQLGWGCKAQRMDRSVTGRDSAIGARLCGNKALTAALLRRAGLPAPVHRVVTDVPAAAAAAHRIGWPVVVKPADRERGEGVAIDIGADDQLEAAFESASALSRTKSVIVERQVPGHCHRLFMAHGRLLYAVKRLPMSIEGDGVSDVAALVNAEVARQSRLPPWDRSGIRSLDELARAAIARAGHSPSSIPAKGLLVPLRRIESTEWGGVDEDVTHLVHSENLRIALAASELFGLGMAGIDIISADIGRPWFENGAIVNEVNFAPLLGGGEISRSHIPAFLDEFVGGNGTIPVEVFAGGDAAWAAATRRWQVLKASGPGAYLSRADLTLAPSGEEWPMPFVGLYPRSRALVLSQRVQTIVLVVQTDEILATGLPLESISGLQIVDERLKPSTAPGGALPRERVDAVLAMLRAWRRSVSSPMTAKRQ